MWSVLNSDGLIPQPILSEFEHAAAQARAWVAVDHNEDGTHNLRPSGFDFVPIGAMQMWGSATAPDRWLICDGAQVSRTTYQSLFAIIGTTYGAGDASTTFNLPDLRQRFPLGKAASGTGATLGATGGAIDHTHSGGSGTTGPNGGFTQSTDNGGTGNTGLPSSGVEIVSTPGTGLFAATFGHVHSGPDHAHSITVNDHTHTISGGTTGTGNPPYVTVNFIILTGV